MTIEILDQGEWPEGYDACFSRTPVEWRMAVVCYVCKRPSVVTVIGNGHYSSKLTQIPDGWFCDRGVCDTSALACSAECAKKLSADPHSMKHGPWPE